MGNWGYKRGLQRLPDYMRSGMQLWIERGVPPGEFLTAVLENDLMEAFGRADETNQRVMRHYAVFLYNDAPRGCWGSKVQFEWWKEAGGLVGQGHLPAEEAAL